MTASKSKMLFDLAGREDVPDGMAISSQIIAHESAVALPEQAF